MYEGREGTGRTWQGCVVRRRCSSSLSLVQSGPAKHLSRSLAACRFCIWIGLWVSPSHIHLSCVDMYTTSSRTYLPPAPACLPRPPARALVVAAGPVHGFINHAGMDRVSTPHTRLRPKDNPSTTYPHTLIHTYTRTAAPATAPSAPGTSPRRTAPRRRPCCRCCCPRSCQGGAGSRSYRSRARCCP